MQSHTTPRSGIERGYRVDLPRTHCVARGLAQRRASAGVALAHSGVIRRSRDVPVRPLSIISSDDNCADDSAFESGDFMQPLYDGDMHSRYVSLYGDESLRTPRSPASSKNLPRQHFCEVRVWLMHARHFSCVCHGLTKFHHLLDSDKQIIAVATLNTPPMAVSFAPQLRLPTALRYSHALEFIGGAQGRSHPQRQLSSGTRKYWNIRPSNQQPLQ